MTTQKNKPKVSVKFKRSSTATKVAVCFAIGLSVATLVTLGVAKAKLWDKAEALRDQAAQLEQEQNELEDKIDNIGSLEGFEDIAQEEGYEYPDTTIIVPGN